MIEKRHLKKVYSNLEHYFCPLYSESYKVSWKLRQLPPPPPQKKKKPNKLPFLKQPIWKLP